MTSVSSTSPTTAERRRAIVGASVGNFVEWFDFAIYGYLAVYIGQVYFPSDNPTTSLLASFAAFASAFLFRPLGGFYFGPLADRIGRKRTLVIVISVMSVSTLLVGLLPGYEIIGVLSPVLLVVARCAQGFSAGGEFGGGAAFMAEYSHPRRRGFTVSFIELTIILAYIVGILIVLLLTSTLSEQAMASWGWRVPFVIGGVLGAVGFWIRSRVADSPAFRAVERPKTTSRAAIREVFAQQRRSMLLLCGITFTQWIGIYIVLIYIQTYLTAERGHSTLAASVSTLATLVVTAVLIPVVGRWSDTIGRKPILLCSSAAAALLSYPLFAMVGSESLAIAITGHVLLGAIVAAFLSTSIAALTELFPTRVRASAFSISYGITGALIGGTAPFVATALISATGNDMIPAIMLVVAGVVSAVAVALTKETAHDPLP